MSGSPEELWLVIPKSAVLDEELDKLLTAIFGFRWTGRINIRGNLQFYVPLIELLSLR